MDTEETMYCRGLKHKADPDNTPQTTFEKPWCSVACEQSYFPKTKDEKQNKFQAFIDRGRIIEEKRKKAAEAEMAL